MQKLTLDEFIKDELSKIEKFRRWWKIMEKDNPEHYPTTLHSGDWDEQLAIFDVYEANKELLKHD